MWAVRWPLPAIMLALNCLTTSPAYAQNLGQVQATLARGEYEAALTAAPTLQSAHPLDAALITARAHMELGNLDAALAAAQTAQNLRPDLSAPRLLRGIIHNRMGQKFRAMQSLRRALDLAQTGAERQIVRTVLRQTRAQMRVQMFGGFGLAPSTNINKITTETSITTTLNGQTQQTAFTPAEDRESGVGLRLWGGANIRFPAATGALTTVNLSMSGNFYELHRFDRLAANLGITHRLPTAGNNITTLGYSLSTTTLGGDWESQSHILSWDQQQAWGPRRVSWNFSYLDTDRADGRNSTSTRGAFQITWPATTRGQMRLGLDLVDRMSAANDVANRQAKVLIGWRPAPRPNGLILDGSLSLTFAKWKRLEQRAPIQERREFRDYQIALTAQNPNVSFWGLTPLAQYSFLARRSNHELFNINSHDIFVGMTNAF